jgi:hypothetical protein
MRPAVFFILKNSSVRRRLHLMPISDKTIEFVGRAVAASVALISGMPCSGFAGYWRQF